MKTGICKDNKDSKDNKNKKDVPCCKEAWKVFDALTGIDAGFAQVRLGGGCKFGQNYRM